MAKETTARLRPTGAELERQIVANYKISQGELSRSISRSIDWLTVSLDIRPSQFWAWENGLVEQECKIAHYKRLFVTSQGVRIYASDSRTQGNLAVFEGEALRNLRNARISDLEIISRSKKEGRNVTRLDYSVDLFNDPRAKIPELREKVKAGEVQNIGRKKVHQREGVLNDNGHTLYVGDRSSQYFLRIYDKAIESKNLKELWIRLELEVKGARAMQLASVITQQKVITSGDSFILSGFDARDCCTWFSDCFDPETPDRIDPIPPKKTNYEKWLESVLASIKKKALDPKNSSVIAKFRTQLNEIELEE